MAGIPISVVWLAILAVLLAIEIATLGLTTIRFAGGALIAFLIALAGSSVAADYPFSCSVRGIAVVYKTIGA